MTSPSTLSDAPLPRPELRPAATIVIYDGQCAICTAQVSRLARWDRKAGLAFLSLHDPETARRFPDLDQAELMQAMVAVDRLGKRHVGAAAAGAIAARITRLWPLAILLRLPGTMPFWQWCYRQVASRRYRLGGGCEDGSCRLPPRQ